MSMRIVPIEPMNIVILAVTDAFGGLCIAGMNDQGEWIRPLGEVDDRFWSQESSGISGETVQTGDVWTVYGTYKKTDEFPNHIEDFHLKNPPVFVKKLNQDELLAFLEKNQESEETVDQTLHAKGRSLCLYHVPGIRIRYDERYDKIKANIPMKKNPKTGDKEYQLKCLKSRALYMANMLENTPSYVCIGLSTATPFDGKEYPMVVGIHNSQTDRIVGRYPNV